MKKTIIILAAMLASFSAMAQDGAAVAAAAAAAAAPEAPAPAPKFKDFWVETLATNINLGQTSLTNWAAGGDNTVSLAAYIDGNANYKKDAMFWNNRLQLDYGFLYSSSKPLLQKNADRIYLESRWGYQIKDKLYFSANYDFKSQFTTGYEYKTPAAITDSEGNPIDPTREDWKKARVGKSNFLSPAYTTLALGIDWKPKDWFSVSFAPLTGGYTFVIDPAYRTAYSMKLKKEYENSTPEEIAEKNQQAIEKGFTGGKFSPYRSHRFEFGAMLKIDLKAQINEKFSYTTQFVLFEDYLKDHKAHPCPRINWDNRIDWKLAKYFALTVTTNLIYDDMVKIVTTKHPEGGPAVQFKESIAFGFTYTISSKK